MDALVIAAKVAAGYGKVGTKLGDWHMQYRPTAAATPALAPQNWMRRLRFVSSTTPDVSFKAPSKYGNPVRYGVYVSLPVRVGDYIKGPSGIYFVGSQEALTVPLVVQCDAVVSVFRPPSVTTAGVQAYKGRTDATDTTLLVQWPASIIDGGRMEATRTDLPGNVPVRGATILLPAWPGVTFRTQDRVTDARDRSYTVASAELTDLGWRIAAVLSEG